MTIKRRSIIEFESWLAREIEEVRGHLHLLVTQAEELAQQQAMEQVRLETLLKVQERIAHGEPAPDDMEHEPAITLGQLQEYVSARG